MKKIFFALVISSLVFSCAPSRFVRPLGKKQQAVTANFGGALFHFAGTVIPMPLTAVGYGYGVDSNMTVFGTLHTTSLLYGVVQTDIGITRRLYSTPKGFGISAGLAANLMFDKWQHNFRAYPQIDANTYRSFGKRNSYWYAGFDSWYEFSSTRANDQPQQTHVLLNPHAGVNLCHIHWSYQLEVKAIAPYLLNVPSAVEYVGMGQHGAFGFYFCVYRTFGK
jgi:hypothetical protein